MVCVSSVTVNPSSVTLKVGKWYYGATASVCPTNATCGSVTWYSSNTNVATVNPSSGYIYAKSAGTARIYAAATDGSGASDYCTVTVTATVYVESVTFDRISLRLKEGEQYTLCATVCPENATNPGLAWSTDNPCVATVSNGVITAVSDGTACITAMAKDGSSVYESCCVTVDNATTAVNSVTVTESTKTLKVGNSAYLYAIVCPEDATNRCVEWYSSNTSVATVNPETGLVYARSVGTAYIYAAATDGSGARDYCLVTVTGTVCVEDITLSQETMLLTVGKTKTLYAEVCPANATNRSISWSSSNPGAATVCDGVVTAIANGNTYIMATANDGSGVYARCLVVVENERIAVNTVTITESSKTMTVGDSAYLYAVVCPENATNRCVEWCSSDTSIATVNPNSGLVYAKKAGTVSICATAVDGGGASDCCTLTVEEACCCEEQICIQSIRFDYNAIAMNAGQKQLLPLMICPENATNKGLRWEIEYPDVISVEPDTYEATAHCGGSCWVTVHTTDGSNLSTSCEIQVFETVTDPIEETSDSSVVGDTVVADPVDAYTGAHLLKNALIGLTGGQNLSLVAQYSSTRLVPGSLGTGWYHNYEKHLVYGECEILVYNDPASYARYAATEDPSVYRCQSPGKSGYLLTVDCCAAYPYTLNCNFERTECYDAYGRLVRIIDHHGFVTQIAYAKGLITITDMVSGRRICMETDACGKITRVYDDAAREVLLTYDGNHLVAITDVNGNTLRYTYDAAGRVLYGTDAENIRYFENTYDTYGRVLTQQDGVGSPLTYFTYGANGQRTTVNRNGHTSTRYYDKNGMLLRYVDENGNEKQYTYDASFLPIEETDGRGYVLKKTYTPLGRLSTVTDRNGNTTTYTYDGAGNVTRIIYPPQNGVIPTETFVYNSSNRLLRHTDLRGTVTTYTYGENGMPLTKKIGSRPATHYVYENGLLKSVTDPNGNVTRYSHDAVGRVSSMTDAQGNTTAYEYDKSGHVLKVTDPNGKTVTTAYDGNYQKTAVTDQNGHATAYAYNGNMKNTAVTLPDGSTVRYAYDGEDRRVSVTDRASNITLTTYDAGGRVITVQTPDNGIVSYEYDAAGNVIKETNQKGAVIEKTYDPMGNLLTVKDEEGNITRYQYDSMNRPVRKVNAVSGVTLYTYSVAGDLLCETDALGHTKRFTYDECGSKLSATDARGNTVTYTYDAMGRLLTVTDPLGNAVTYTYDSLGRRATAQNAAGHTVTYGYDALGRETTITDARGNTFSRVYDAVGNLLKVVDAKGNTVSEKTYNALNQPITVMDAAGQKTTYTYNLLGKIATVTDPQNHRQEYTYNTRGQNTAVKDALNNTSRAAYDLLGNVTRLAGPLGGHTDYTYDTRGRLTSSTTASGGTLAYTYNELSLREQFTNARGQKRKYFYDALGRVTGYVGDEDSVSYTYDENGNVLTVTDAQGTITRTYDALNRVASYTDTYGHTISYVYDAVGNLSRLVYPDGTAVTYAYDENNNLTRVTDWAGRVTSYSYDENNKLIRIVKANSCTTTIVYDAMQRVTSTVEKNWYGTVITGFSYSYDEENRIIMETDLAKQQKMCYTYDSLHRVTKKTVKNMSDVVLSEETFTYDAAGNITDAPENCFAYDTNNRLTSYNGVPVTYDLDGNMLTAEINGKAENFTFDSKNRLISTAEQVYTYNAEDVRIRNVRGGIDTTYVYDTNAKLSRMLMKTTNGTVTKYVYGLGLIGEEKHGSFKTYHYDYRGSTVAITDEYSGITDTMAYDAYGKMISHVGESFIIFGYNGRDGVVTDKNGLIYMRARFYSPDMKRFVNADIVPGEISNAVTLNRYAYANGNPVSNVDPFGLEAERGEIKSLNSNIQWEWEKFSDQYFVGSTTFNGMVNDDVLTAFYEYLKDGIENAVRPNNIGKGLWAKQQQSDLDWLNKYFGDTSAVSKVLKFMTYASVAADTIPGVCENLQNGVDWQRIVTDVVVDAAFSAGGSWLSTVASSAALGAMFGSVVPFWGNLIGGVIGTGVGVSVYLFTEVMEINGKSIVDHSKDWLDSVVDGIASWFGS